MDFFRWATTATRRAGTETARLRAADQVLVIDRQPDRLKLVEALDATPIDDSNGDAVQQVLDLTRGKVPTVASRPSATRRTTITVTRSPV